MTIEEQLKREILTKYKSVRAFTTLLDIPYSTLDSVFKRGIANAGVVNIIKVFNALDLDIESICYGELKHKNAPDTAEAMLGDELNKQIMMYVQKMSPEQKRTLLASFQTLIGQDQEQ